MPPLEALTGSGKLELRPSNDGLERIESLVILGELWPRVLWPRVFGAPSFQGLLTVLLTHQKDECVGDLAASLTADSAAAVLSSEPFVKGDPHYLTT